MYLYIAKATRQHDKILAVGNAYCEVMWEEMNGKPLETSGDVVPNDGAPDGGGHTDGAQFGRIIWVFVGEKR